MVHCSIWKLVTRHKIQEKKKAFHSNEAKKKKNQVNGTGKPPTPLDLKTSPVPTHTYALVVYIPINRSFLSRHLDPSTVFDASYKIGSGCLRHCTFPGTWSLSWLDVELIHRPIFRVSSYYGRFKVDIFEEWPHSASAQLGPASVKGPCRRNQARALGSSPCRSQDGSRAWQRADCHHPRLDTERRNKDASGVLSAWKLVTTEFRTGGH